MHYSRERLGEPSKFLCRTAAIRGSLGSAEIHRTQLCSLCVHCLLGTETTRLNLRPFFLLNNV